MASESPQQKPDEVSLKESTVIDTDVHLSYNEEIRREVSDRMEKPFSDYTDPDIDGDPYPHDGFPRTLGGRKKIFVSDVTDPETVQEEVCKEMHVDHPVLNIGGVLDKIYSTEQALGEMRAINDVLIENFLDEDDRFYGLCSVATRDPEAAAEEIDRIGDEDQIVGVYLVMGTEYQEKPLGAPRYDVMYRAMEDNDLTPVYHISQFGRQASYIREYETNFSRHVTGTSWSAQGTLTSLIAQGTPEKFPDLDFLFLEGGWAFIPFMMGRLNRHYAEFRAELPMLEKSPEQYLRDRFYFSNQPVEEFDDPTHLKAIMDIVGLDSLVFSSDYPHHDFDYLPALEQLVQHYSAEEREKLFYKNAAKIFSVE